MIFCDSAYPDAGLIVLFMWRQHNDPAQTIVLCITNVDSNETPNMYLLRGQKEGNGWLSKCLGLNII